MSRVIRLLGVFRLLSIRAARRNGKYTGRMIDLQRTYKLEKTLVSALIVAAHG